MFYGIFHKYLNKEFLLIHLIYRVKKKQQKKNRNIAQEEPNLIAINKAYF